MPGVTREQVEKARNTDLFAYLQSYEPGILKRDGANYRHREHDSLVYVSAKNYWYWNSRGRSINALDYRSLYLSSMSDRRGIFALISKDENRSLPLRKPRRSVRGQIKDGQTKAATKKAEKLPHSAASKKTPETEI